MDCRIVVYVHDTKDAMTAKFLKTFTELGYTTLADGKHGKEYTYLYDNMKQARLFIFENEILHMFDRHALDPNMTWYPDFGILFNDDCEIDSSTWEAIRLYCQQHLTDQMIDMTNTMKVHEVMGKPVSATASLKNDTAPKLDEENCYQFRTQYLESIDTMLYEVKKPFVDLPYTSVTRNYKNKGHLPFFTDLFICQSWGVARADVAFLAEMWKELKMDGVFDLDALMKHATEKCMPSEDRFPEPEPEVYRRSLENTIVILKEKASGSRRYIPNKN